MNRTVLIGACAAVVVAAAATWWLSAGDERARPVVNTAMHGDNTANPAPDPDSIVIPELSQIARSGELAFKDNCAACHGEKATGTDNGPPLIHPLYRPGHHDDRSFEMAAKNGTRAHHWRFGDMPPVPGITDAKIRWITKYVREVQLANGIR
ncbi:MAG: c-type cytochrome [Paracoccaceae bacterium]